MKANGLVLAASITSQTLTPRRSHNNAISLMKLMLMNRKVFSTSLASSAISGELTGTTSSIHASIQKAAQSGRFGARTADDLGRVLHRKARVARVDSLGCKDQKEVLAGAQSARLLRAGVAACPSSCPARRCSAARPACPRAGARRASCRPIRRNADRARRMAVSGVGTQITATSAVSSTRGSVLARQAIARSQCGNLGVGHVRDGAVTRA